MNRILPLALGALVASGTLRVAAQKLPFTPAPRTAVLAPRPATPRLLPGTRPDIFTTILGNALNSTNGALPNSFVRLRDARVGRIIDTQLTDKSGLFVFHAIDPGSYIVELIGNDQSVLAASQLLYVNAGEVASAVVKLPFRAPALSGLLGHTVPSAAAVTSSAAASSVLATTVAGQPASP